MEEKKELKEESKKEPKEIEKKYSQVEKNAVFWHYYQMGDQRSLAKISRIYSIPVWLLKKWSSEEKWAEKISEQDELAETAENFKKKADLLGSSDYAIYSVCMEIINDKSAAARDKLAATEKLEVLRKRFTELKEQKKIFVKFEGAEKILEVLKKAGIKTIEP